MRIWLKIMAVVCLLSAGLFSYDALSPPYLFQASSVRWPDLVLAGAVVLALVTLSGLCFAVARSLDLLGRIAAQLPPLQVQGCEGGDHTAAPRRDEPWDMRHWLHVVGVSCLLPTPLIACYVWYEIIALSWADAHLLAQVELVLVTLSCLSFAGARSLDLSERISAHLPPLPQADQAATGPTGERAETAAPGRESARSIRVWLHAMTVLCLLPAPLMVYDVLLGRFLSEALLPRWGWADLVFVGTSSFVLVALSSLSFAGAKGLHLLERVAVKLPMPHPPPSAPGARTALYMTGLLCLLPTPLIVFRYWDMLPGVAIMLALVTLSSLSFARAKSLDLLQRIAAHVPRLQHLPGLPLTGEGPLSEDVTTAPSPTQPEKEPPVVPPAGPPARPALSSRARRFLFIGVGIIALTAVALVSYHLDPAQAYAHANRGIALAELGRHEEALAAFDRAIQLDPDLARAHEGRGATLLDLGRYEEALAAYDRAIALHPYAAAAHHNRGWALGELGRYEEALAAFDWAIELDPDAAWPHGNRGWVLMELGRHEEALAACDRAIELDPNYALAHLNRGWVLGELGRYEEEFAAYDRAIQLDPDAAWAHYNRGVSLAELGRHEEALAAHDRAIELEPDFAWAHNNTGWALMQLGRREEALAAYDRAIALDPDETRTHYNRACAYSLLGRRDEALRDLKTAIDLDSEAREAARTDDDFDNLHGDPEFRELVGLDNASSE